MNNKPSVLFQKNEQPTRKLIGKVLSREQMKQVQGGCVWYPVCDWNAGCVAYTEGAGCCIALC